MGFARVSMNKQRPIHLNLLQIRLPISGIVSLLHRFSGALLFLLLPLILWVFQTSLSTESAFNSLINTVKYNPVLKLVITLTTWAFLHHFMAGIRFLLLDVDCGVELRQSRLSAKWVMFMSIVLTVAIAGWLW